MAALLPTKPIITTKEARKLLGASSKSLTNEELEDLIRDYEQLARFAIRQFMVRKSSVVD